MQQGVATVDKALSEADLSRKSTESPPHHDPADGFRDPRASEAPTRLILEALALHHPSEVLLSHRGVMIETRRMHEAGTEAAKNPLMRVLDVCVSTCMVRHALNVYSGRECDDMLG